MNITKKQIEDYVTNGLSNDIFIMERAYFILKKISEHAETINSPNTGGFGGLFRTIQNSMETEAIMAVSRLYDAPNKKYPTRCIKGLLYFIKENANNLPSISEKYNLTLHLNHIKMPQDIVSLVEIDAIEFSVVLTQYYLDLINNNEIQSTIEKLKTLRDKTKAHNEMVATFERPTWIGLENLLQLAKDLAGIIGWGYLSTAYVVNGKYILTTDAKRPSRALERLINKTYFGESQ